MKSVRIVWGIAACLLAATGSSALGAYTVEYVGNNPWANAGFPSTGGTGGFNGQTIEKTFTSLGDIPIIVNGGPSNGVDTLHIDERVRNNTGVPWTDFHLVVQPIDANPNLVVTFANVNNPTGEWTSTQSNPNILSLFGNVPNGGIFSLSFDLVISSDVGAFNLFGIHQYPTIPEPSTLALLGCAGIATVLRRRR